MTSRRNLASHVFYIQIIFEDHSWRLWKRNKCAVCRALSYHQLQFPNQACYCWGMPWTWGILWQELAWLSHWMIHCCGENCFEVSLIYRTTPRSSVVWNSSNGVEKYLTPLWLMCWPKLSTHSFQLPMVSKDRLCQAFRIYDVIFSFLSEIEYLHYLRQACFGYFQLGGMAVSGPIGLLSVWVLHIVSRPYTTINTCIPSSFSGYDLTHLS